MTTGPLCATCARPPRLRGPWSGLTRSRPRPVYLLRQPRWPASANVTGAHRTRSAHIRRWAFPRSALAGWVTYLSCRRGTVPPLPAPVRVEPVEELGTLIPLTPERFTAGNPAHVELASQVRQILDQAGLLGPELFTSPD